MERDQQQTKTQQSTATNQAEERKKLFYSRFWQNRLLLVIVIILLVILGGLIALLSQHATVSKPEHTTKSTVIRNPTPTITQKSVKQNSNDITSIPTNTYSTVTTPTTQSTQQVSQPSPTATVAPTATPVPTYSISGYVFNDANGNGSYDSGEQGYANQTVWILSLAKSTTTDSSGHYSFGGLTPGTYNVEVNNPDTSKTGEGDDPKFVTITNSNGSADFGFK